MRDYERFEPVPRLAPKPVQVKPMAKPGRRPRVNRTAVVLGDPLMVFGALLRVFSRRR